jgi:hypothetical protein
MNRSFSRLLLSWRSEGNADFAHGVDTVAFESLFRERILTPFAP